MKVLLVIFAVLAIAAIVLNIYDSYLERNYKEKPMWIQSKLFFEVASIFILFWILYCIGC